MPNLAPPVASVAAARAYRGRILAALPRGSDFEPLMTCYLTDTTAPEEVDSGFREGVFTAVKLYPARATTNSAFGVTDYERVAPVLESMARLSMPLLIHGEVTDPEAVSILRMATSRRQSVLASALDKAIQKGVIHENTASRYKSRLSARVNALGTK